MTPKHAVAIFLVATCAQGTLATAQNAYRCADGYSQQPCPGGKSLAVDDARTDAQKKQADAAAKRDARLANAMEKERVKQEAQPVSGYVPPPQFNAAPEGKASGKMRKPETFTAVAPGEKKKPSGSKQAEKAR